MGRAYGWKFRLPQELIRSENVCLAIGYQKPNLTNVCLLVLRISCQMCKEHDTFSRHKVTSASFIFDSFHTTTEWMPLLEALYLAIKLLGLCPSIPCGNTTRNSCIRLAFYLLRRTSVLFVIITVTKTCTSFIYSTGEYLSVGWS